MHTTSCTASSPWPPQACSWEVRSLAGADQAADAVWVATTLAGVGPAAWWVWDRLRHRQLGVDIIALLALLGTLAVGEYLAGAVITLMVATGRALESWAGARARHDLEAVVARQPTEAHRYRGNVLVTEPVAAVARGDVLLVKPGEVIAVDGVVVDGVAVLDESSLTRRGLARRAGGIGADPERDGERRWTVRPQGDGHCGREHLRRHRSPGRAGRGVERALRAACRPVRRGVPRRERGARRAGLGRVPGPDAAPSPSSSWRRPAR